MQVIACRAFVRFCPLHLGDMIRGRMGTTMSRETGFQQTEVLVQRDYYIPLHSPRPQHPTLRVFFTDPPDGYHSL